MARIALTMIVKDNSEAEMFRRCLDSFMPHVDGLYVAVTGTSGEHNEIIDIVNEYGGKVISTNPKTHPDIYTKKGGMWIFSNFAAARNASWGIVDQEYDYLTWADVDDILPSGHELKEAATLALEKGYDGVFFTYWYAVKFGKDGAIKDVVIDQLRERLLRPGVYRWTSRLHEVAVPIEEGYYPKQTEWDLSDTRRCVWIHCTTNDRVLSALKRNAKILQIQLAEEEGKDPRTLYSLAKVYFDIGDRDHFVKAGKLLEQYLQMSGWDAERSNALEYLGMIHERLGNLREANQAYHQAIVEYPTHILPYLKLANTYFELGQDNFAKHWLNLGMKLNVPKAEPTIGNPHEIKLLASTLKLKEAQREGNTKDMVYWAKIRREVLDGEDEGIYEDMVAHDYINDAARGVFNYAKWLKDHEYTNSVKKLLESIPEPLATLPFVNTIRKSVQEVKKWPKGSIVYYASFGMPHFEKWGPDSLEKGIGGSETAVIRLSEEWAKAGRDVTVYADIEKPVKKNGVDWRPYYEINFDDEFDTLILWRSPHLVDRVKKARNLFMDLHDVAFQADWNKKRIDKIDKVFFKSKYHRNNLPDIPDEKCVVISNGI